MQTLAGMRTIDAVARMQSQRNAMAGEPTPAGFFTRYAAWPRSAHQACLLHKIVDILACTLVTLYQPITSGCQLWSRCTTTMQRPSITSHTVIRGKGLTHAAEAGEDDEHEAQLDCRAAEMTLHTRHPPDVTGCVWGSESILHANPSFIKSQT